MEALCVGWAGGGSLIRPPGSELRGGGSEGDSWGFIIRDNALGGGMRQSILGGVRPCKAAVGLDQEEGAAGRSSGSERSNALEPLKKCELDFSRKSTTGEDLDERETGPGCVCWAHHVCWLEKN